MAIGRSCLNRQHRLEERGALQMNIKNVRHDRNKEIEHLKTVMFQAFSAVMKDRLHEQFELYRSEQDK